VLWVPLSFSNRYSVRPLPSVRIRPSLVLESLTVTVARPMGADVVFVPPPYE
jgi:hypothetical protein